MALAEATGQNAASTEGNSSGKEKKRTRPVSACENCRSRKVKCNLKPDVLVCEGCFASGKECVFRIDDLSPALRLERFGQFGPPGENARQIASRNKKSKSSSNSSAARRTSSVTQDEGEGSAGGERQVKKRRQSDHQPPSSEPYRHLSHSTLDTSASNFHKQSHHQHQYQHPHHTPGLHEQQYPPAHQQHPHHHRQPSAHHATEDATPHWAEQPTVNQYKAGRSMQNGQLRSPESLYNPGLPSMYNAHTSSSALHGVASSPAEQQRAPSLSHLRTGLPSFRSAFPPVETAYSERDSGLARQGEPTLQSPVETNRSYSISVPSAASPDSFDRALGAAQVPSWRNGNGVPATTEQSPPFSRPPPFIRSATTNSTQTLPPLPSAWPSRMEASPANRPLGSNDLAASHEGEAAARMQTSSDHAPESKGGAGAVLPERRALSTASSNSHHTPTSQRIALPFFRWFGATANTPGIRRIKVGVYHETEEAEELDSTGSALVHRPSASLAHTSPATVASQLETSQVAPSPASTKAGTATETPSAFRPPPPPTVSTPTHSLHEADTVLSASSRDLFEPNRPRYPRRDILIHLVKLFFKLFKSHCFPWLDEGEIVGGAESGELPAILANSICALTARFSNREELRRCNAGHEPFADMAKVLIVPMLSWPSIDVIEALVIISYAEFAAGADSGLWNYVGLALRMSSDLGLQHEVTICSMRTQKEQDRARLLFWAIISLDRITCFGTGRPLTMRDDSIDCELPPLRKDATSDDFVFGHIVRTLLKRGKIGELLNRKTDEASLEERGRKLRHMWLDLAEYYETLPPSLRFGVNSFRKMASANQGAAFVYLHVLLQSTMSLLNRPSLLRKFDREFAISAPSKLASIANHASGTIVSILRFAEDAAQERRGEQDDEQENSMLNPYIDGNPYLDQLILPAGRAFLSERETAKDALTRLGHVSQSRPISRGTGDGGTSSEQSNAAPPAFNANGGGPFQSLVASRQYAQTNLVTSQAILDRLSTWWKGASWPARALRQESGGAMGSDVKLDGSDEEAQPVSVRDVEMVLKWARARAKMVQAGAKTPAAASTRRGSVAEGAAADESSAIDVYKELSSLLGSHYHNGDASTSSSTPPVGLGFSGSFGTTSDVDIQALIDAWANEENFVASNGGLHPMHPPSISFSQQQTSQGWAGDNTAPFAGNAPVTNMSSFEGSSQPVSSSSLRLANDSTHHHHHHHPHQHQHQQQQQHLDASAALDLDAMQLEEFFFKSKMGAQPLSAHPDDTASSTAGSTGVLEVPIDNFDEALFSMLSPFVHGPPR